MGELKRDITIDFLRGTAVFLMIVTHVNGLLFGDRFILLDKMTYLGATICFSTFLFCSAFVYGVKSDGPAITLQSFLHRVVKILSTYYFLAFFIVIVSFKNIPGMNLIFEIVTFRYLPPFIEFLVAFALFDIVAFFFQHQLKKLSKYPLPLIALSLVLYVFSRFVAEVDIENSYLLVVKSLLVGDSAVHSFGVFSYLPIFVIGYLAGDYKEHFNLLVNKRISTFILAVSILLITIILAYIFDLKWERWPPSSLFHLVGITYIFSIMVIVKLVDEMSLLSRFFIYMSRNTLEFYVWHIIILFTLYKVYGIDNLSIFLTILMNLILFLTTFVLVYVLKDRKGIIVS